MKTHVCSVHVHYLLYRSHCCAIYLYIMRVCARVLLLFAEKQYFLSFFFKLVKPFLSRMKTKEIFAVQSAQRVLAPIIGPARNARVAPGYGPHSNVSLRD